MQRKKQLKISMSVHIRVCIKLSNEYNNLIVIKDTQLLYLEFILFELIVDCGGRYCINPSLCL